MVYLVNWMDINFKLSQVDLYPPWTQAYVQMEENSKMMAAEYLKQR